MAETIRIEIPIETVDKTEPELSNFIKKLGKMGEAADKAGKSAQDAGKRVSKFDESADKTQKSLSKWAKEKYQVLLEAKDRISPILSSVGRGMKSFSGKAWNVTMKAVDLVTAPVRGILNLLKNPIFQAGAILGVSIGLKDTIDTYKDFESSMSKVKAISGASEEEMDKLTEKAKQMGATTKFTATESAEAFNYMAMAGWETEDMLGGIEGILSLAAASGTDLATTSDIVTDALTAFGMQANEAGHFSDVLAAASSKSNTNVTLMGETFKYAGAMAGTLGYSIEDVALAKGLMANAGIKGNMAGTALNSIFTRLSTNTHGATDALKKLGIEYFNADGSARAFGDVMKELRAATADYTDEQKANLGNTIAGTYAQKGFLAILNATTEDYEKLSKAVNNADGAAGEMAEIMMDNLAGSLTLLQSAADGVKLSFGERLAPYVKNFAEWLTDVMPMIDSALDSLMDCVDKKIEIMRDKLDNLVKTEEWQNADFFGKVKLLWDDFIVDPFSRWWNGTGKAKIAEIIGNIGSGLGTGLRVGIMTLLGIDVSDTVEEASNIGASFAKGFSDGFDFKAVSSKIMEGLGNLVKNASKLLPGGEAADLSSVFSAALLMKIASPFASMGRGAFSLGKSLFGSSASGTSLMGSLIGSANAGTGILGFGANTAIALGAGNLAGGASLSTGALSALGLGATAGGVAAGASLISGGVDFYQAIKSEDKDEAAAYGESGAWKVAGVGAGALAGASIGSVVPVLGTAVGALIGAGIGGIAGWLKGNKVKEEYEKEVAKAQKEAEEVQKEAEEAAAKAQKVFEATGFTIDEVKFKNEDLLKILEDTEVSTEEFAQYFRESCAEVMENAFGDMHLSLEEIKKLADDITFHGMQQSMEEFSLSSESTANSISTLKSNISDLKKQNWHVSLGLKLSESDMENYKTAIDTFVSSSQQYVQDSHYEVTVALNLLTNGRADTTGMDTMYEGYRTQIDETNTELQRVLSEAMADGVISTEDIMVVTIGGVEYELDEASALEKLQEQIIEITDKLSQAEENAAFESLKIKYNGAEMDAESFAQFQTEVQENVAQLQQGYDNALYISLKNIDLQLQEGAITQEEYDTLYQQIVDGYNEKVNALNIRVGGFQLDTIASSFSEELEGILPDIEGNTTEKLTQAMNQALSVRPDVSTWDTSFITEMFNLEGLDAEIQTDLQELLTATAASIPKSYTNALHENMMETLPSVEEMLGSNDMLSPFTEIGTTYGTTLTTGMQEGIEAGSPQLRTSAESTITNAFSTPFSVTARVNITPHYTLTAGAGSFLSSSLQTETTRNNKGTIPKKANGGYVSGGPQLSWLAEEGYGEFVIPTNPSRRKRALELYEQAGKMLGVSAHAEGGFVNSNISTFSFRNARDFNYMGDSTEDVSIKNMEVMNDNYLTEAPFYVPAENHENKENDKSIQINVNMAPEFHISSVEGQSEETILQIIRRHIHEMADELGGEMAEKLSEVFSNMPLKEA